jgi:DNA primase
MPNSISDEKIEEIVSLNDIVDVIGDFISLKKAGANYTSLCPFHKEKTPSFSVSSEKQIYHCFGCGEGGNAVSFLMKYKNYTFIESLEYLANKAGVKFEVEDKSSKQNYNKLKVNYQINREAAIFFHKQIYLNNIAMKYFTNRGIHDRAIKYFGLGYAPDKWDALFNHLRNKGFDEKEIDINGLIIKSEKSQKYYDRFRNRVIFPIWDTKKRIIGFGGRVLDDKLPKYINSPDSIIFNKGRHLYNLNNAKDNIKNAGIILVEGYMDVIKLAISGYNNAVASLGTALTENQIKLMKKYTKEFYVSYDSDEAGLKAALKAANLLKTNDLICKILVFPDNMDPDDFITKYGGSKYKEKIEKSYDYFDFLDFYLTKNINIESDKGKLRYIKEMDNYLLNVKNSIEKELYIEKIAKKTGVSKDSIISEFKKGQKREFEKTTKEIKKVSISLNKTTDYEDELLLLLRSNREILKYIQKKFNGDIFKNTRRRKEFHELFNGGENCVKNENEKFKDMYFPQDELLQIAEDYVKKIELENIKSLRSELIIKLLTDMENESLKEQISIIDKEILKLRGLLNG